MKKYLDEITKLYSKAKMFYLTGVINEKNYYMSMLFII